MRKFWTEQEIARLQELYPHNYTEDLLPLFPGRSLKGIYDKCSSLGIKKTEEFKAKELQRQAEKLKQKDYGHRYKKGHIPANKGKRMTEALKQKLQHTFFKKGNVPHNALPIGTEVLRRDRCGKYYYKIKVSGSRTLVYKHVHLWQQHYKKQVPKGYKVIFKDGNSLNCVVENLECISNEEMMLRNSRHNLPKEIIPTMALLSKLKKTVNEKQTKRP